MIQRLRQFFARYANWHMSIDAPGAPIADDTGTVVGQIERVHLRRQRVTVSGWADADEVVLIAPRSGSDAVRRNGAATRLEFSLDQFAEIGVSPVLAIRRGERQFQMQVPMPDARLVRRHQRRLAMRFMGGMLRAAPAVASVMLRGDQASKTRAKRILGFDDLASPVAALPADLFDKGPEPNRDGAVTLVLPVFNALDLLQQALDRIERHTDLPWHLIVIEDGSTDPRVRPWLREWARARTDRVTLLENDGNLGFVASVNRGLEQALTRGAPVVLVNSDAMVPAGWASRLLAPIHADPNVASVTPMSNNAEILTAPAMCRPYPLENGEVDAIDRAARVLNPRASTAELPTGVGFCMAMNIAHLQRQPAFDTTFGRGYGEEVDWCQKVRAQGGRHLGIGNLFVEHAGGASFGDATKRELVAQNGAEISRRYPAFDGEVQGFLGHDPLAGARLAVAIGVAAARARGLLPIYLAHSMGGGAEMDLQRRIARDGTAIVLRVGGRRRWRVSLAMDGAMSEAETEDFAQVLALLAPVQSRAIIYNCGVGDPDPLALPDLLLDLAGPGDRVEILFHDYLPLSPSYTLLDADGRFRGVPDNASTDPAHQSARPDGTQVSLAGWRQAWGRLLDRADRLTVFSHDSAAHVGAAFPAAAGKIAVEPHLPLARIEPVAPPRGGRVIAVLGNINAAKGAGVVVELARLLRRTRGAGRLVLIGNIDPTYRLPRGVTVHGNYLPEDIPAIARRYQVTDWLIPSVWPETFSFTTHEALATGLPVWCFDLGAQAEAARPATNGHVVPLPPDGSAAHAMFAAITARGNGG